MATHLSSAASPADASRRASPPCGARLGPPRRGRWSRYGAAVALLPMLFAGTVARAAALDDAERPPAPRADAILVVKSEHRLYLLRDGVAIRSYPVKLGLNPVGPKRHEMDFRTPEGRYVIDGRNRNSRYFRALHVSYPNAEDRREAAAQRVRPGGDIMIHGLPNAPQKDPAYYQSQDWTNGCIALSNDDLLEVWALVPRRVPVEIRP
jgi:murein L,D-transpeptidase YafK